MGGAAGSASADRRRTQARRHNRHRASRRRPTSRRADQPAAADLPRRHRLCPRRRDRHQQEGRAGRRSQAGGSRGLRGRRPPGRRVVQAVQGRRDRRDDAGAADSQPLRRGVGSAAARRAAVRVLPRRLSRAPRQRHALADRPGRLRPARHRAAGHGRHHVSAHADRRRRDGPQSRVAGPGDRAVRRPQVRLRRRGTSSRSSTRTTRPPIVEQIRNQVSLGAIKGADHQAGRPARGPQGADPGQRGLHELSAGAAAQPECVDARRRQPHRRQRGVRRQHGGAARALLQPGRDALGSEGRLRPGQQEQRLHLRARPARAGRVRARHQRGACPSRWTPTCCA